MSDVSEKELERRAKQLRKIAGDRKCMKVLQDGSDFVLTFTDGQVFRCRGTVVDYAALICRGERGLLF